MSVHFPFFQKKHLMINIQTVFLYYRHLNLKIFFVLLLCNLAIKLPVSMFLPIHCHLSQTLFLWMKVWKQNLLQNNISTSCIDSPVQGWGWGVCLKWSNILLVVARSPRLKPLRWNSCYSFSDSVNNSQEYEIQFTSQTFPFYSFFFPAT
jgi:hypothetical protein